MEHADVGSVDEASMTTKKRISARENVCAAAVYHPVVADDPVGVTVTAPACRERKEQERLLVQKGSSQNVDKETIDVQEILLLAPFRTPGWS
jgi:hypothetical protein